MPLIVSFKYLVACFVLSILLLVSCRRNVDLPETIDAYYVKYQIQYLETKAGDIPTRILPGHMDTYYTKYFILSRIEGFFNQFSLIQIANLRHRRVTTLLNFFGNKVFYIGGHGELPAAIIEPDHISYKYTGRQPQFYSNSAGEIEEGFIEPFHMLDASISKSWWNERFMLGIGANNLFDYTNIESSGLTTGAHSGGAGSYPVGWGRSYFISLRFNISKY